MRQLALALLISASGALLAPPAAFASDGHPSSTTATTRRVYDPYRRDYHAWTLDERRAYREYLSERHRAYLSYRRQTQAERRAYWRWRHEREERLEHERR